MEFEELQKIWDSQNNQPLYVMNEKALHSRILSKKKRAYHITNISELLLIIVNIAAGSFIFGMSFFKPGGGSIPMYLLSTWMFACVVYVWINRLRRKKRDQQFDRSMHADLDHTISVAAYQVRLSQIMHWNILPVGALTLLGVWGGGKPIWVIGVILIFFALAYYAGTWEHNVYRSRKRELEILKTKLEEDTVSGN